MSVTETAAIQVTLPRSGLRGKPDRDQGVDLSFLPTPQAGDEPWLLDGLAILLARAFRRRKNQVERAIDSRRAFRPPSPAAAFYMNAPTRFPMAPRRGRRRSCPFALAGQPGPSGEYLGCRNVLDRRNLIGGDPRFRL